MRHQLIRAGGSSKRADRVLHDRQPQEVAGGPAEDISRFPNPASVKGRSPCTLRSNRNSCVPFPQTSFAFSSSLCQPTLHRQGFGTMDALTPLPTGLPACRWPHRFGLRRSAPTLGLGPVLALFGHPVRHLRDLSAVHPGEVSWVRPSLLPNRAIRQNFGGVHRGLVLSPHDGRGLHHPTQLGHACPQPYPPVQPHGLQLSSLPHGPPHLLSRERTATRLPRPIELRRGLDFNQLDAGTTPRHVGVALLATPCMEENVLGAVDRDLAITIRDDSCAKVSLGVL